MDIKRRLLTDMIHAAFPGAGHPGRSGLMAVEFAGSAEEASALGFDWHQIQAVTLRLHAHLLRLMTPAGVRFVLPAFLRAAVMEPRELDVGLDAFIGFVAHYAADDAIHILDADQKQTFKTVLHYLYEWLGPNASPLERKRLQDAIALC